MISYLDNENAFLKQIVTDNERLIFYNNVECKQSLTTINHTKCWPSLNKVEPMYMVGMKRSPLL